MRAVWFGKIFKGVDWGGICVTQMSSMEGDVEDSGDRDFLSLGTTSRSTSSAQIVGFPARQASAGAGEESMYLNMMSSLSRNGLNMLAGGANSGFSLKPPTVGNLSISPGMPSLRNLGSGAGSERTGMVSGGGFTGFYRSSVPSTRLGLPGTGLRLVSEDLKGKDEAGVYTSLREESGRFADKIELPLETDLQNLSADENLKLILKLGKHGLFSFRAPAQTLHFSYLTNHLPYFMECELRVTKSGL